MKHSNVLHTAVTIIERYKGVLYPYGAPSWGQPKHFESEKYKLLEQCKTTQEELYALDRKLRELDELDERCCKDCENYTGDSPYENTGFCDENVGCGYCIYNVVDNDFWCKKFVQRDIH